MRASDVKPSWLPTGGHEMVTSDAHPGLADAIASVLPGASGHGVAGRGLGGYANVGAHGVTTRLPLAPDLSFPDNHLLRAPAGTASYDVRRQLKGLNLCGAADFSGRWPVPAAWQ